ncbi:cation transporter [Brachybacterium endophyticum]|uniref:Cation transporter n=1 Tax=Brachybacterium endophyticum TaxID=2182385 RepID=A0A2U2RK94_9MICO|nr:cation diffusion facilitator family transporter [Brachybacterium endophyticum]PWH06225.1 cation transporter [Brachybacterium endophyticum]
MTHRPRSSARRGDHSHGDVHLHGHGHAHGHDHPGHSHPTGVRGVLHGIFVPHSHDAADSIDDAMEAHSQGIRAVKVSLVLMLVTTVVQAVIVAFSGSVALLADTVHNLSDALTAVPLWIAFVLSRRVATRRYTYGFNRAEDLAGLFIVLMIALSAVVAAVEAIDRMVSPRPMENIGWVIAAGVVGFLGNEAVAVYRIRVGRRIGSAALVADGIHARTDGFTSLAVVAGGIGVLLGFPLADPIVGLLISAMIAVLLVGTVRSVGRRLMDGVEPELVDRAERALGEVIGIDSVDRVRMRWIGHRLHGDALVRTSATTLVDADRLASTAEETVRQRLPNLDEIAVRVVAVGS